MSNHKGLKFPNTLEGFKAWAKAFQHMMTSDIKASAYYTSGDYYLECNKVVIKELSGKPFLGTSVRGYNEEDRDFSNHYVADEEKEILRIYFSKQIDEFCKAKGITVF